MAVSTKNHDLLKGVSKPHRAERPGIGCGTWSNSRDIDTANRQPQKRVTGPTSYTNFTISKKGKR